MKYKIFTYGTLMRNQVNHHLLVNNRCKYLYDAVLNGYVLYDTPGNYPAAVKMEGHKVYGEVYEVHVPAKQEIDILEEVGVLYDCVEVTVESKSCKENVLFYEYIQSTQGMKMRELNGKWTQLI